MVSPLSSLELINNPHLISSPPMSSSSSPTAPSNCHSLANTFLNELGFHLLPLYQTNHDLVAGVVPGPKPLAGAFRPKSKIGDPVARGATTRYYVILLTRGDKALSPEHIQVMDVTNSIPKGCMVKALAFCSGVAFNFNFSTVDKFDNPKLCVISSDDGDGKVIDVDQVITSKMPDPNIIKSLANSLEMRALVSSEMDINLAHFLGHVGDYVGTKFGEEKKAEYLKMLSWSELGSLNSVEIWHMLTLQARVMESVRLGLFMKLPIDIDMPSASMAQPTPRALGWEAGCSSSQGLKRRPCIPDLNQVLVDLLEEEEETDKSSIGGEGEGNNAKKRKAAREEAQAEVPTKQLTDETT